MFFFSRVTWAEWFIILNFSCLIYVLLWLFEIYNWLTIFRQNHVLHFVKDKRILLVIKPTATSLLPNYDWTIKYIMKTPDFDSSRRRKYRWLQFLYDHTGVKGTFLLLYSCRGKVLKLPLACSFMTAWIFSRIVSTFFMGNYVLIWHEFYGF